MFMENVNAERNHGVTRRLRVIEICQRLFQNVTHSSDLSEHERKYIAGMPISSNVRINYLERRLILTAPWIYSLNY